MVQTACRYDVVVVGLGGMGSAAAYHLARRGSKVLGLEAHSPVHTFGSSHGESRIIRMAYMEHPDYVPLLRRAYELWEQLQSEASAEILRLTGGLFVGSPEGPVVGGSLRSAREHSLPHEVLDASEIHRRYPALRPASDQAALFEGSAGVLFPERCIEAHLRGAREAGAELHHNERVLEWEATASGVVAVTEAGRYEADTVVLTAGAWLGKVLSELCLPLQPERIPVYWLRPRARSEMFGAGRFPIYIWEVEGGHSFYGFPHLERPGVKVGRHHSRESCDPDLVSREITPTDESPIRAFIRAHIPDLDGPVEEVVVCMYTNTPDEHFLVDRHPELPNVVYAGGFSGHGFKFASVMGEILADMAMRECPTPAADFLRADRLLLAPEASLTSIEPE